MSCLSTNCCVFFFQAEDGIRDLVRSRGLGDVYKRQILVEIDLPSLPLSIPAYYVIAPAEASSNLARYDLSLIHI